MEADPQAVPPLRGSARRYAALTGIFLMGVGQYLLAKIDETAAPSTPLGIWVNEFFHFGLFTIDNVLAGSLLCILGSILLVTNLDDARSYPEEAAPDEKPLAFAAFRPEWVIWILVGSALCAVLLSQLNQMEYHWYFPWFWLGYLAIFLGVAIGWDRRRGVDLSLDLKRQDLIWLTGLLMVGFLIATYRLQGWPDQLMLDEGVFGSTARDVATGIFTLPIFAQGVDGFPILSTFWQAGVMKLFGVNIWGWRFASVLLGVMSIIPLYLLARDMFNRGLAVISCLVLLTTPYFLVYARLGYTNIQPEFLVALALYLLYLGLRKASNAFLLLAGYIAGLGFYTYFSGRSAFVIAVLFLGLAWLTRRYPFPKMIFTLSLFVLGTALVVMPHVLYGIRQDTAAMGYRIFLSFFNSVDYGGIYFPLEELYAYAPPFSLGGIVLFYNPKIYLILILRGIAQTFLAYQKPGMLWGEHYLACPLAGTYGAFFYFVGLVVALKHLKQMRYQILLLWFFTIFTLLSALNTFPPREDHMVPILPALSMLTAFGLETLAAVAASLFAWLKKYQRSVLAALLAVSAVGGLHDYFVLGLREFPPRPEDVMSWAGLHADDEAFYYVYEVPLRDNFVPWMMFIFRNDVVFGAYPIADFISSDVISSNVQKKVIFYPPELDSRMTPFLQAQWGRALQKKVFLDAYGAPALMAGMNTPFVFERERALADTFLDAFRQTPFVIFLAILLLGLGWLTCCPCKIVSHAL
ncbi:MAG: glycosyltransferase family 39 protein [Chloroflexota bacterium]